MAVNDNSKRWRLILSAVLALGLIVGTEFWLGWSRVLRPWLSLSLPQVGFACLLLLVTYLVRTLRLTVYYAHELNGHFLASLRLMLMHNFWNNLLPMRSGELSFPILMQQYFSISPKRSLPVLFWFRLLDLYIILMLGACAYLVQRLQSYEAIGAALLLTGLLLASCKGGLKLLGYLETRAGGRVKRLLGHLRESLPTTGPQLVFSFGLTLLNWTLKITTFAWVITQFADTSLWTAVLGAIGGELTSVLPIHGIAGAGSYEAGVSVALLPAGMGGDQALQAAINLHLFMLSGTLLGALISFVLPKSPKIGTAE